VALKNYYQLLEIAPTSSADEVKRAFRQQIARYHPDKVQHLGREFQEMAADRAAELTEAYRILSDEGRRNRAARPSRPPHSRARHHHPERLPRLGKASSSITSAQAATSSSSRRR